MISVDVIKHTLIKDKQDLQIKVQLYSTPVQIVDLNGTKIEEYFFNNLIIYIQLFLIIIS